MPQNTPNRGYTYPLYTEPTMDFPAQIQDLATDIDTDVTNLQTYTEGAYDRPSARIFTNAGQTVTASTNTLVNWTGATTDYAAGITPNLVVGGGLTLTERGVYQLSASVSLVAPGAGLVFGIRLAILSSAGFIPVPVTVSVRGIALTDTWINVTCLHYHTGVGSDNLSLEVWQNSAGSRTLGFKTMTATKTSNTIGGS